MIKIIDKDFLYQNEFKRFCKRDSFGTRIYSHYLCYGYEFDFVAFWVQINDTGNITSAFCRIDNEFIVCINSDADFEEINSFLNFQSKISVTFDNEFSKYISACDGCVSAGDILKYSGNNKGYSDSDICVPQLKDYHDLLLSCESDNFFVPEYMTFLSDVSRRQQRKLCDVSGIYVDSFLASCAMTVSYTDFSVILGAVATNSNYRKRGLATNIVKSLAEKYKHTEKVYIYTTIEKNSRFYESLGFVVCGKWIKYTYGG